MTGFNLPFKDSKTFPNHRKNISRITVEKDMQGYSAFYHKQSCQPLLYPWEL
jgi:hypothetical protein